MCLCSKPAEAWMSLESTCPFFKKFDTPLHTGSMFALATHPHQRRCSSAPHRYYTVIDESSHPRRSQRNPWGTSRGSSCSAPWGPTGVVSPSSPGTRIQSPDETRGGSLWHWHTHCPGQHVARDPAPFRRGKPLANMCGSWRFSTSSGVQSRVS